MGMNDIVLPTAVEQPRTVNPESLIIFGLPKCGKTTAVTKLDNYLLIDVEGGSNKVAAVRLQPDKDWGAVAKYTWLRRVAAKIKEDKRPYKFVVIDTISYLDELSEWVGTYNYMNSLQGKKFNRKPDGTLKSPLDQDYESVHNVPEGYGYRWSRQAMLDIFDELKDLGSVCTIFVCHVADKYIMSKQGNTEVRVIDLSLTGKLKSIIARDVDAIGYVWNEGGTLNISFKGNEERVGGIRGDKHIQGYEGPLDWKKIFVEEKAQQDGRQEDIFK